MSVYADLIAAGYPTARLVIPGMHSGPVVVLAANLDGTIWVQFPHTRGGPGMCVSPAWLEDRTDPSHRAWRAENTYGLTPTELQVLRSFADARVEGRADHEHYGLPQSPLPEHRRHLVAKGLVAVRQGVRVRSPRGGNAVVWAITLAGRHTLCQPCPTLTQAPATASA